MSSRGLVAAMLCLLAAAGASAAGKTTPSPVELFRTLQQADAVVQGAAQPKRVLYIFFDANCYYCNLTWRALQPYEKAGLQTRWVPVAYQKESSVGRAAAIMLAKDRAAALRENELRYRAQSYDGGIPPSKPVPPALTRQLEANTKLMEAFGAAGTPAIVWQEAKGSVRVKTGLPARRELPAITGLPEQKLDDPALADLR